MINREQARNIPHKHNIVLAKAAEMSDGKIPLRALQETYMLERTEAMKRKMIQVLIEEINIENSITPKEKN